MNKEFFGCGVVILVIVGFFVFVVFFLDQKIKCGFDFSGGIYFVLEVVIEDVLCVEIDIDIGCLM